MVVITAWKEVCEKHQLFAISKQKCQMYPEGKNAAVWDEIEKLSAEIRSGDYGSQHKILGKYNVQEWNQAWLAIHAEAKTQPPCVRPAEWRRPRWPHLFPFVRKR